jgi:hypothetical protein
MITTNLDKIRLRPLRTRINCLALANVSLLPTASNNNNNYYYHSFESFDQSINNDRYR